MIPFLWAFIIVCVILIVLITGLYLHRTSRIFIRNNADGIKIILLVVAGLYTAWVYHREATDNRIEATLAFVEKAETGKLRKAFERINMLWIRSDATPILKKYREDLKNATNTEEQNKLDKEFDKSVIYFIEDKGLHDEIFTIHGFYKSINICVIQDRCHEPTACQLFAEDLQNFSSIYISFLSKWDYLWDTDVLRSLKGFCARCAKHLPPEGRCTNIPTRWEDEMHVSP